MPKPSAFKLGLVAGDGQGSLTGRKPVTSNHGNTQLYSVVEHNAKCSDGRTKTENVLSWSTKPTSVCSDQLGPSPINLAGLIKNPTALADRFRDAFTNPAKYVTNHWHYRQVKLSQLLGKLK